MMNSKNFNFRNRIRAEAAERQREVTRFIQRWKNGETYQEMFSMMVEDGDLSKLSLLDKAMYIVDRLDQIL